MADREGSKRKRAPTSVAMQDGSLLPDLREKFDKIEGLEQYLEHASVYHVGPLTGGGGHPHQHKMTMFLAGGIAVAAKAGADEGLVRRAQREVAAWILAKELGFPWLVPTTVLRRMPVAMGDSTQVAGSVQILWPQFRTALDMRIDASYVDEVRAWPVACWTFSRRTQTEGRTTGAS